MIDFDFKDKNQIYQLIAGLSGFTVILIGALIVMAPFFPAILLATILTLATWPAFAWLSRWAGASASARRRAPRAARVVAVDGDWRGTGTRRGSDRDGQPLVRGVVREQGQRSAEPGVNHPEGGDDPTAGPRRPQPNLARKVPPEPHGLPSADCEAREGRDAGHAVREGEAFRGNRDLIDDDVVPVRREVLRLEGFDLQLSLRAPPEDVRVGEDAHRASNEPMYDKASERATPSHGRRRGTERYLRKGLGPPPRRFRRGGRA